MKKRHPWVEDFVLGALPLAVLVVGALLLSARLRFTVTSPDNELPHWLGTPVWKSPGSLMVLQEIIHQVNPDIVVETGTYKGGGALFFASLLDLEGRGRVVSVDIRNWQPKPVHKRVKYLIGSSVSPAVLNEVRALIEPGAVVLVDLDSNHAKSHVLSELRSYSEMVSIGSYLIVEDATTGRQPLWWETEQEPGEAVREFLSENHLFASDGSWEKRSGDSFGNKYLRRIR